MKASFPALDDREMNYVPVITSQIARESEYEVAVEAETS